MAPLHPFDPIQDAELRLASKLVKDSYPASADVHFIQIDRLDPPKKDMIKYLELEKYTSDVSKLPRISRVVYVYYYTENGAKFHKALVNVTVGHVITKVTLPEGVIGPLLPDDVVELEDFCNTHPAVLAEIEKLKLPGHVQIRNDPWIYGTDDPNEKRPLIQFYMYLIGANGHSESNHYSLPLKFSPVFEAFTKKFVRMDFLPGGFDETTTPTMPWRVVEPVEYHPELNGEKILRDVKPLIISQPEGPSFSVEGTLVKWQGWELRVVPNSREGFALYNASFKGRQVFYRLALSEMTVPYGDPRAPYHRKQAFDLGDCGFGVNANHLALGCDCLGVIKYFDTVTCDKTGSPNLIPNTVCMHEQDNGLLYKHVNYRNNNAVVARRREFIVQTIATVANYEYIVNIKFITDGSVHIEVRATGILSTMPIDENVSVPWGTNVGPGVMAAYHQHLLSFRIDPAIDGHKNTVVYDDVKPMEEGTTLNPYGVGFTTERSFVNKSGYIDQSPFTNRAYKIINENVLNPTTQKPVGYKIEMPARQMILGSKNSFNVKRAAFATQQVWVTKYRDGELYAAGEFTNQSQNDTGLGVWANGDDDVRNDDIVVWATLGFTHIPRPEDFPVMPVEIHTIALHPFNFFERNPALDIPQSSNTFNKSVLVGDSAPAKPCCKTVL